MRSACFCPGRFANNRQSFTLRLQKATVCHLSDSTMVALIRSAGAVMSSIKNKTLANGNIMKAGFFFFFFCRRLRGQAAAFVIVSN